jgi:hypothetical protein
MRREDQRQWNSIIPVLLSSGMNASETDGQSPDGNCERLGLNGLSAATFFKVIHAP